MFSDPDTALMALVILNFSGTLLMFLFVLRSLDAVQRALLEQYSHMQLRLVELEQRMAELGPAAGAKNPEKPAFSFGGEEDLAAMLERRSAAMQAPVPARSADASLPDLLDMDAPADAKKADAARSAAFPLDMKPA